jgi:predicted N-acyltransferase
MSIACTATPEVTTDIDFLIKESVEQIDKEKWNGLLQDQNKYLTLPYLKALEVGLSYFDFRYIEVYNDVKELIGIAYCQIIKITEREINVDALNQKMGGMLPKNILRSLDLRMLVCGNAFASGENGFLFVPSVNKETALNLVSVVVDEINLSEKKDNRKISLTLIKEFWPESFSLVQGLKGKGCMEVNIDHNMVLQVSPQWSTFKDYLSDLNSKFRTKAKKVLKESSTLSIVDFNEDNLNAYVEDINSLYNTLVDKTMFSFGRINAQTLRNVKAALGEDLLFKGYFLNGKLVGFSTATFLKDALDGNYIGLDYTYNKEYCIYQRMLYDFIEEGINRNVTEIRFGRTAEQIKSGVGAEPVEMLLYARHRNKVTNALLKPFVQNIKPSDFELRKPFKQTYYND